MSFVFHFVSRTHSVLKQCTYMTYVVYAYVSCKKTHTRLYEADDASLFQTLASQVRARTTWTVTSLATSWDVSSASPTSCVAVSRDALPAASAR